MKINKMYIYILITLVFFTGCSLSKKQYVEGKITKLKGEITIACDKNSESDMKVLVEGFKEVNPDINIKINTLENYNKSIEDSVEKKKLSEDIILYEEEQLQQLLWKYSDRFLNLTSDVNNYKEYHNKKKIENSTKGDSVFSMPITTSPYFLIYNVDLAKKYNINMEDVKTYEDFINCAKLALQGEESIPLAFVGDKQKLFTIFLNQLRGSYLDKEGKLNLNNIPTEKALNNMQRLYNENIAKEYSSNEQVVSALSKGKTFCAIVDYEGLRKLEKLYPEGKGIFAATKLPAFEAGGNNSISIGGKALLISNESKQIEDCRKFINYAASKKGQKELLNKSNSFPVNSELYSCIELDKESEYYRNNKIYCLAANIEKNASHPFFHKYNSIIEASIKSSIEKTKDNNVANLMAIIRSEVEKVIEKENKK